MISLAKSVSFMHNQVKTVARIVQGDPGKVICREANRLKPAAVVMGTRGRGLIQRFYTSVNIIPI
jgi:nucleotide-binding universal stress UspA family protein